MVTNYGAPNNSVFFLYDSSDQDIMPSVKTQVMNIMNLASTLLPFTLKQYSAKRTLTTVVFSPLLAYAFTIASGIDPYVVPRISCC